MHRYQHTTADTAGDALAILSSYRRRFVLARVSGADGAVPVDRLAAALAAEEQGTSPDAVPDSERKRNAVRLHHVDVPPLAAAGLVRYDQGAGLVSAENLPLEGEEWLEMPVVEALEAWNGR